MAAPGPASCPTTHATESCDLKAVAARQRPHRYPKESREPKPLPHSCKAQYSSPKSQDTGRSHPEADADQEEEVKRYSNHEPDAELQDQRPATPSTPEHNHDRDDPNQGDFHGGADSLDDDSSSDYINNTSDDDDYDDGKCVHGQLFCFTFYFYNIFYNILISIIINSANWHNICSTDFFIGSTNQRKTHKYHFVATKVCPLNRN